MTDNTAEQMQEPIREVREIDRLFEEGLLGNDNQVAMRRYCAGQRFYRDWQYSGFNPDFRSGFGGSAANDETRLTAGDRYVFVFREIPPKWKYLARCILIDGESIDGFIARHPIFNRTAEEKAVLLFALQDTLDFIANGYEMLKRLER